MELEYFDPITQFLPQVVSVVIAVCAGLYVSIPITAFILLMGLIGIFLPSYTSKNVNLHKNSYLTGLGKYNSFIKDLFSGFFVIKGNSIEENISRYHEKENADVEKLNAISNRSSRRAMMFLNFFNFITQFIIIALLVREVLYRDLPVSLFVAFSSLTNQIIYPLYQLANFINSIKSTKSTHEKIEQHLAAKIPIPPDTGWKKWRYHDFWIEI